MGSRRGLLWSAFAMSSLVLGLLAGSMSAGANGNAQTYLVGVDGAGPSGHNFEYVDYFPRGQVLPTDPQAVVGNGAIVHFQYNLGSLDGLHTATLLPSSETPAQAWATQSLVTLDEPEPAPKPILNPAAILPPVSGCGASLANPCTFDGTTEVNSGALPAFAGTDFFVKLSLASSTSTIVHYVCLIHPGMQGNLKVVPGVGSSPAAFASNAASQLAADTAGALAAEAPANTTAIATNPNGNHTITMTAGTATQFVEVAEMLPHDVTIQPGDLVKWVTASQKDPHTVSFPDTGTGPSLVDPLTPPWAAPPECEGSPDGPPGACTLEIPINPAPSGPDGSAITNPATSGVIANFPPFANNFSFSFPSAGTFAYQCRIHEHMNGTISVQS